MPLNATRFALRAGATATVAAVIIGGAALPAHAAASDVSQAEGRLLAGSGAVDLDTIAALAGSYGATAPGGAPDGGSNPLNLALLDTIGVNAPGGIQLLGSNGLVDVGVAGQYSATTTSGAVAAAGAVTGDGAIQVGAPGTGTSVDLTPLLAGLDLDGVVSDASVELGALSARAESTRSFTGSDVTTDYQVASADVSVVSPAVQALVGTLNTTLDTTSDAVNTTLGGDGVTDALTGSLVGPLTAVLDDVPLITVGDTTATVTADVDLQQAVAAVTETPITSGAVTIDLSTGTIAIDLADLYTLNDLPANTRLLASETINAQINASIADILTTQVPDLLTTALTDTLNAAALNVTVATDATVGLPGAGVAAGLDITVDTTVGALLGASSTEPTVAITGTGALTALDTLGIDALLATTVDEALLPAVTTAVAAVVGGDFVANTVTALLAAAEGTVTALDPLLDAVNELVSITINSQTDPAFSDADGDATGASTVRAVRLELVPAADLATVDVATATVQADAFAGIAITDPEDGTSTTVPTEEDTTDVPVSGTAEPGSTVDVTLDGDTEGTQTTTTDEDGTWTVTFPDVALGDHEATAVETIGALVSDPDSVTFEIVAAAVDPTDPPTPGTPGDGDPGNVGGPGIGDGNGGGVGNGGGAGNGGGSLAFTGAEVLPMMLLAGLLLAAGGGTLVARRLRRV